MAETGSKVLEKVSRAIAKRAMPTSASYYVFWLQIPILC